jgi:hypothetical protein
MKSDAQLSIRGQVQIKVGKRVIKKDNNIDLTYASTIGALLLFGTNSPYAGTYAVTFSLPQSVVVLLLNNGVVVAQLQTTLQGLNDTLNNVAETTTVTFIGSDATTSQYTFNQIELYTMVNNVLFMRIAEAYLQTPITKDQNDQVQVTWQIIIQSAIPFVNINNVMLNDCNSTCGQSAVCSSNVLSQKFNASVFNFVATMLIVPSLFTVLQNQQVPMSAFTSLLPTVSTVTGVTQILFFDSCLNNAGIWVSTTGQVASAGENFDNNYVYVSLNVVETPSAEVSYLMPFVQLSGGGVTVVYPIAFIAVQGTSIANQSQTFGILLKIPYGPSTLVQLSEAT